MIRAGFTIDHGKLSTLHALRAANENKLEEAKLLDMAKPAFMKNAKYTAFDTDSERSGKTKNRNPEEDFCFFMD